MHSASLFARNVRIGEQVRSFGNEFPTKRLALARFPLGVLRRVWFFYAIQVVAIAAEGSDVETIEFWLVVLPHSAATCAPFSATERFMKKTRTISATAITAKRKNVSK